METFTAEEYYEMATGNTGEERNSCREECIALMGDFATQYLQQEGEKSTQSIKLLKEFISIHDNMERIDEYSNDPTQASINRVRNYMKKVKLFLSQTN